MPRNVHNVHRLAAETRLLMLLAGAPGTDADIASLVRDEPIDWDVLIDLTAHERATALLLRHLPKDVSSALVGEVRLRFDRQVVTDSLLSALASKRLQASVALLERHGVRSLLIKGGAMATSIYRSFAARPMHDLDLVVDGADAEKAFALLQEQCWRWDRERFPVDHYRKHQHLPPLLDVLGWDFRLELHTELLPRGNPFGLDRTQVLRDGREIRVGDVTAIVPAPEHLLLHTCIHFTWSHMLQFGAWRAIRDVIALAQVGLDWDRVIRDALQYRAESACYWTLHFAERLAGGRFPPEVMTQWRGATSRRWHDVLERHGVREIVPSLEKCPSHWLRRSLWTAAFRPGQAGHGAARPWLLDTLTPQQAKRVMRKGLGQRAWSQRGRLQAWLRYARLLASK